MGSYLRTLLFVSLLQAVSQVHSQEPTTGAQDLLAGSGCPEAACATERGAALWRLVQSFYRERGARLAWVEGEALSAAGVDLRRHLQEAERDGLDPRRYDPSALGVVGDPAAVLDVGLTYGLLRYASDLAGGRFSARGASQYWRDAPMTAELVAVLQEATAGRTAQALDRLRPTHPQYTALADSLRRHHALAASGGWPEISIDRPLRPGARGPVVSRLRERLRLAGDLAAAPAGPSDRFDPVLAVALKRFQARHGLGGDGVLDRETAAAVNVPVEERIRQIELNLDRWRWQPRVDGGRQVLVNIPTFELFAYENGREVLKMRVVTGQPDSPTPVFGQAMTHVIFSPYWNVPPNITASETLPAVMRDRAYLRRNNLEVVRGGRVVSPASLDWRSAAVMSVQFRQRPGAGNSLGGVKFLLPNPFHVYLHDTPSGSLFARPRRTFSHGCVRLEKPETLANWVLDGVPGWTRARIRAAMWGGRERHVPLPEPVPVSIAYFTTWVEGDGAVQFRPDVYKHDAAQLPLLQP